MRKRTAALTVAVVATSISTALAQPVAGTTTGYLEPPQAIIDILEAEPAPVMTVSPARDVIAVMRRRSLPSIEEIFHTVAETLNWLDKYVKNAPAKTTTDAAAIR